MFIGQFDELLHIPPPTFLERADVYGLAVFHVTFIGRFDKLFYLAFSVFRTRNVYVLVIFRWRLSVGSTNSSIPFCVFRTRNIHLLVVIHVYSPVRQTFNVES